MHRGEEVRGKGSGWNSDFVGSSRMIFVVFFFAKFHFSMKRLGHLVCKEISLHNTTASEL